MGEHCSICWGPVKKDEERWIYILFELRYPAPPALRQWPSWFLVIFFFFFFIVVNSDLHCWFPLVPRFSGLHTQTVVSLPFLVFHPLDSRSWDSSVFKTMWTNSYKFFTIYSLLIVFLEIIMFHCFFLLPLMQCIDVSCLS